ncbi:MAG: hypothetical protein OXH24_01020, partial [Cyanobacteria bacterium MAG IRC3_bin_20]|nr:hypothetical protein [Cyanobacteria bacterium MAG IRC3_bin_20]
RPSLSYTTCSLLVSPSLGATNQGRGSAPFLRLEALRWALTVVASSSSTASASVWADRQFREEHLGNPISHQGRQWLERVLWGP